VRAPLVVKDLDGSAGVQIDVGTGLTSGTSRNQEADDEQEGNGGAYGDEDIAFTPLT
jgi:hypothetical protein